MSVKQPPQPPQQPPNHGQVIHETTILLYQTGLVQVFGFMRDEKGQIDPKRNMELFRAARSTMEEHFRKLGLMGPSIVVPNGVVAPTKLMEKIKKNGHN